MKIDFRHAMLSVFCLIIKYDIHVDSTIYTAMLVLIYRRKKSVYMRKKREKFLEKCRLLIYFYYCCILSSKNCLSFYLKLTFISREPVCVVRCVVSFFMFITHFIRDNNTTEMYFYR